MIGMCYKHSKHLVWKLRPSTTFYKLIWLINNTLFIRKSQQNAKQFSSSTPKFTIFTWLPSLTPIERPPKRKNRSLLAFRVIEIDWCVVRRRTITPFALTDTLGPKQLPESLEWYVEPTKKFCYATQTQTLRLKRLNFWCKIVNIDGFLSKFYKKHKKCATACVYDNKKWLVSIPTIQMLLLESLQSWQCPANLSHAFTMRQSY